MCSFPGTEAQPAAPANAFGSQQAKSNPAQLSPPVLSRPASSLHEDVRIFLSPNMGPWHWWIRSGSRTSPCSGVLCICASLMLGPKVQVRVSVWQVLKGYWEERQRGTHLPSAWVHPGRRNHSSLGQLHAWHGVALKTMRWSPPGIRPTLPLAPCGYRGVPLLWA